MTQLDDVVAVQAVLTLLDLLPIFVFPAEARRHLGKWRISNTLQHDKSLLGDRQSHFLWRACLKIISVSTKDVLVLIATQFNTRLRDIIRPGVASLHQLCMNESEKRCGEEKQTLKSE